MPVKMKLNIVNLLIFLSLYQIQKQLFNFCVLFVKKTDKMCALSLAEKRITL
jgi:hypothetical protein